MISRQILTAFSESLANFSGRSTIISASTPLELSKRSGIDQSIYALKLGSSSVDTYIEDYRPINEIQRLDITSFVKTLDGHKDRDVKYSLLMDMRDDVFYWAVTMVNSELNASLNMTRYIGVVNVVDDREGYYAMTQRVEFEVEDNTVFLRGDDGQYLTNSTGNYLVSENG